MYESRANSIASSTEWLVVPLHQLSTVDLPEVFQLEALEFQHLYPLDELKKGSQVLVQDSAG